MIRFPRMYNGLRVPDIYKIYTGDRSAAPLDKFGNYIFPKDTILINGHEPYLKVIELNREPAEEEYGRYGIKYSWFVKCQDRSTGCTYRYPAGLCENRSTRIYPPLPYVDALKQLHGQEYVFTRQGCFRQATSIKENT